MTPEFLSFALAVELSLGGRATPDRAHCAAPVGRTYLFSAVPPGCSALGTRDPALGPHGGYQVALDCICAGDSVVLALSV